MTDAGKQILQMMTAAASILLMGACGVQLWFRLTRLMRGQETADGLAKKQSSIPLRRMAWAAGIALLSRLAAMLLAYGFYRVLGVGELSFADSFEQLWLHWDTRHYIGIAQDGYTAVGNERLRLVFFPLYPLLMRLVSPLTGGNLFAAGTAVSLVCSAAAAALLYDLAQMQLGERGAWLAVAYFLLNPLSVFLGCVYTEALFICLTLAAVCLLVCLLAGCGSKEQTVTPDFVLTYADNQPADYPTTQGAERFAALVKERTGGKVVIQVKSGGEYGTEQEVWQQLSIGGIDFARLSLSVLAADLPKLNVLQLPCLYEDAAHMWRVLDGPIGEEFLRVFAERDMVGLSWYDAGARSFYSDKSLRSLEDLQGMTIRVQDANVVIDMVKLLGGDPVTLAYSDVYAAFETDKIDAAENNWPAYLAMEHYKVARYYLVDEHSRVPEIQLASGKTWAKLPDEYRSVLRECARESARYERELWTQQEAAARKTVLAAGCREIQLSDEEKERFRELVQPLYEKYAGPYLELVKKIQQG